MAGGTPNHAPLSNRIGSLLDRQAPPDCTVIRGDLAYEDNQPDVVLNPLLLAEVLSPSTEAHDRGKKFKLYRTIYGFCEYLLVHQDRRRVEHYSKRDDGSGWLLSEHSGKEDVVQITRLGVRIVLADLYASALGLD